MHISRRTLLKTLFSSAVAGGLAVYTNANAQLTTSARFEIKQLPLKVPHLPSDLNGFRIAFVSDIHLGIFLPLSAIDALTAAIRHEAPDLLLLGGDYLWVHKSWFWRDLGFFSESPFLNLSEAPLRTAIYTELLTRLSTLTPRHGIFGCYGNHEHWEGTKLCSDAFAQYKIPLLKNEEHIITHKGAIVRLFAADDYWTGQPTVPPFEPTRSTDEFRIVLAHNPDYIAYLGRSGLTHFDLALCGHTHGGQIVLPVVGAIGCNVRARNLIYGVQSIDTSICYTSRGFGTVELPLRVNCPPELVIFTLIGTESVT